MNTTLLFTGKPKGMHWRTHERLWWKHQETEMEQLLGMKERLDGFGEKVG